MVLSFFLLFRAEVYGNVGMNDDQLVGWLAGWRAGVHGRIDKRPALLCSALLYLPGVLTREKKKNRRILKGRVVYIPGTSSYYVYSHIIYTLVQETNTTNGE